MRTAHWYAVLPAGTGALILAAGAILLVTSHSGSAERPLASDCGIINCSATVPPAGPGASTQGTLRGHRKANPALSPAAPHAQTPPSRVQPHTRSSSAPARAASPAPAPSPSATPSPSPTPSPAGKATVTYTVDQRWTGGFEGHFTIVNNGRTPLRDWVLSATLPGDHIETVWSASYRVSGTTLILSPASYQPSIASGASQSAYFTASGNTASPTGCEFNSRTCSG